MNKVKRYVEKYLSKEKHDITYIPVSNSQSGLSLDERTLIYKYTEDGYENVNELYSRTGKAIEEFAKYGLYTAQNEKEVLFNPGKKFRVY